MTNKAGKIVLFEGIRKQIPSEISSFPKNKSIAALVPRNHIIRHQIIPRYLFTGAKADLCTIFSYNF